MPYYDNNLDDLLAFDGIRSFTGGQASGLQSDQLAANQVQEMYNMTLSVKGSLETRLGATLPASPSLIFTLDLRRLAPSLFVWWRN